MARLSLPTALALATAAAATGAAAQAYGGGDRYGPSAAPAPAPEPALYGQPVAPPGPRPALRGRVLAWPGKVQAPASSMPMGPTSSAPAWRGYAPAAYAPRPSVSHATGPSGPVPSPAPTYAWRDQAMPAYVPDRAAAQGRTPYPWSGQAAPAAQTWTRPASQPNASTGATGYLPAAQPAAYGAPAGDAGWRPVFAGRAVPNQTQPQPVPPAGAAASSGYSPAVAAARAAPPDWARSAERRYGYDPTQNHTVRFYSVARPFGLRPDPAPIPPQFFTATADLGGEPPGPLPVSHTSATTRAAVVGGDSGAGGGGQ